MARRNGCDSVCRWCAEANQAGTMRLLGLSEFHPYRVGVVTRRQRGGVGSESV